VREIFYVRKGVSRIMRTWLLSPLCAVSVEAAESISAELRRGGPLVGRTSRRVSQSGLKKTGSGGSTAALCDSAWKVALPAALCVKAFYYLGACRRTSSGSRYSFSG